MSVSVDFQMNQGDFRLDANFEADPGVTVIFGPSGSGKTTLLKGIAGLQPLSKGQLLINGIDASAMPSHQRSIGYVFQNTRVFPHLNVAQNIDFAAKMGAVVSEGKRKTIIELLELTPLLTRRTHHLSGGEAQRVALARALLSNPKVLCMDEPLSALDHGLKQRILPFIERLRDTTDIPILYVTHDAAEMARLADQIVLMQSGKTILTGPAHDVLSDPSAVPILGVRAAGTVISATVGHSDPKTGLCRVEFDGGQIILPDLKRETGREIRLRVAAQDIILATERPNGMSALNILKGQITQLHQGQGPGVMVQFQVGATKFLARVTRHSMHHMELMQGQDIYAIIKASAFDPAGIGT